jgi:RNA polymerase sigma-70 factor, ECF subfamily
LAKATALQAIKRYFSSDTSLSITDVAVFSRMFEKTYLSVFRYVYGLTGGSLQEAEDLTAEVYARAWKAREHFHGNEQAILGWLLQIAKNLVIDLARNYKARQVDEDIDIELLVDPDELPELDIIAREQIKTLWRMLGLLSEEPREMLVLRYILGWQVKQIAEHIGSSENNVSVTMRRALQRLRNEWSHLQEKENE